MDALIVDPADDRSAYLKARKTASHQLYFRTLAQKEEFQKLADDAGYSNFNQYLLDLMNRALSGNVYPPGYVDGLVADVEKLRGWVVQKDAQLVELHQERAALLRQRADLLLTTKELAGAEA
jgi:hypothetical protein